FQRVATLRDSRDSERAVVCGRGHPLTAGLLADELDARSGQCKALLVFDAARHRSRIQLGKESRRVEEDRRREPESNEAHSASWTEVPVVTSDYACDNVYFTGRTVNVKGSARMNDLYARPETATA